jgi:putative flippase GtrA
MLVRRLPPTVATAAVMASFIVNFSLSHFVVFRVRRSLPAT